MTRRLRYGRPALLVALAGCALARPVATGPEPGVDPLAEGTRGVAASSAAALTLADSGPVIYSSLGARTGRGEPAISDSARRAWEARPPTAVDSASLVDSPVAAFQHLEDVRRYVRHDTARRIVDRARELTRLGLWDDAGRLVADAQRAWRAVEARHQQTVAKGGERAAAAADSSARARRALALLAVPEAELLLKRHRYAQAAQVVDSALATLPQDRDLRLLRGRLQVDAWQLDSAAAVARALLAERAGDAEALLLQGRVALLERRFDSALVTAKRVQQVSPAHAGGWLLEADVRFWREDTQGAEAPLREAIRRDPFDADARFAYGYAIWRRVDARQLDAMAGQWNLALVVDPLHYVTHWHWGNGHTNLTYADYAHPSDSLARERLKAADSLIAANEPLAAVALSRRIEREFPESMLPALLRGSAFYMAYDMALEARLDSAQATFAALLGRKRNYGPAHNALAATIKQRQVTQLAAYDSLERVIAGTPLPPDPAFDSVFADVRYYPGDRVRKMARQQLGPSIAYIPLLARQGLVFKVPPLHHDLAQAMERPFFRGATTFDNRQWMDIRGVGSGAAGIEYVERGAHWERNVLNHEYVHLFHGRALTDAQNRRIRVLYHDAMAAGRTLDYYAGNNESEFFAQAYEAYISPVKAHPLNHKAMNTHADLARRDTATFLFVDSLVRREQAYLAGDTAVFRSNWAQAYAHVADSLRGLYLSDSARSARAADSTRLTSLTDAAARTALADSMARRADTLRVKLAEAAAVLDTALRWDDRYVPAMLSYAALRREERNFADAERWIARARAVNAYFGPVYSARATLVARRAELEGRDADSAFTEQAALLERALAYESDLAIRASLNGALRGLYARHGRAAEAVEVAEAYAREAPLISTYLRDRRDEAATFAAALRSEAGYASRSLAFFDSLVPRKPQNWGLRSQYASALWAAGRAEAALATLDSAQRILRAGGNGNGGLASLTAEIRLATGDTAGARRELDDIVTRRVRPQPADRRVVRVLALLGHPDSAERRLATYRDDPNGPADRAEMAYTRAVIADARRDAASAEREYRAALAANPYHRHARLRLVALLRRAGRAADAEAVLAEAKRLKLPLGPDFDREAAAIVARSSR